VDAEQQLQPKMIVLLPLHSTLRLSRVRVILDEASLEPGVELEGAREVQDISESNLQEIRKYATRKTMKHTSDS